MEWLNQLNGAVEYIESKLENEYIDIAEAAKIACSSSYHFQRMFSYMSGLTVTEYIRRRRMTLAADDIARGEKVIDAAMKYGYNSPTAFTRTFKSVHGVPPSKAGSGALVKHYPRIRFQITVKGVEEVNYKIESMDAFRVIGVSTQISSDMEENFKTIPLLWDKMSKNGTLADLVSKIEGDTCAILAVNVYNGEDDIKYYISAPSESPSGKYEELIVPAALWAKFPGSGKGTSIQDLMVRIMTDWMPTSGYEYTKAPEIEVYYNDDTEDMKYEIWLPVRKK